MCYIHSFCSQFSTCSHRGRSSTETQSFNSQFNSSFLKYIHSMFNNQFKYFQCSIINSSLTIIFQQAGMLLSFLAAILFVSVLLFSGFACLRFAQVYMQHFSKLGHLYVYISVHVYSKFVFKFKSSDYSSHLTFHIVCKNDII